MAQENTDNWTYFQYAAELDIPVYVRMDLSQFEPELMGFLLDMQFSEVEKGKNEEVEKRILKEENAKVLTMTEASPIVARQITMVTESDRFGKEAVLPKDGYKLYRYKGEAVIIYAISAREWTMGCFSEFGNKDDEFAYRTITTRFLSWALAPFGIIGFWGVPVDEGIVIQRQDSAQAEAVFLDVASKKLITREGVKKVRSRFTIFKLDSSLQGRAISMKVEEVLGVLSTYCTYFDYSGTPVPVRQMIRTIASLYQGQVIPFENFKPRPDISA